MKGSGRGASGGEEAAWRDLIANYTAEPEADGGELPWPERENLPGPRRAGVLPDPGPETDPSLTLDLGDDTDPALDLGADPAGPPEPGPAQPAPPPARLRAAPACPAGTAPRLPPRTARRSTVPPRMVPIPSAATKTPHPPDPAPEGRPRIVRPASSVPPPAPPEDEDFVPPVPPPLPSLDPVAKGAWTALFGGPGYLLVATMAGWAIPGWAAFLAVAAFVGGFATLVIRMGEKPPRDSGPDDGAVL